MILIKPLFRGFAGFAWQGLLLFGPLLLMNVNCIAAEPTNNSAAKPPSNSTTPGADGEAAAAPLPSEDEDDRARERAAEQAARRTLPKLLRGPYLQCGTPESMIVRWRTDKPGPSLVRFGLSETNLHFNARTRGFHTDHVVVLTNLTPDTRYFYALATNTASTTNSLSGTNNFSGTNTFGGTNTARRGNSPRGTNSSRAANIILAAATNSFITAPPIGTIKPTRVWVLGDSGTRQPTQKAVADGFAKFTGERPIDLWLMLGDNAYTSGKDEEYQGSIFLAYPDLLRKAVLWPTIGNHDGDQASSAAQSGDYYDVFTLPTQGQAGGTMSGTEAYYSFDYANAHFICLDSHDTERSTNGLMMRWLKSDLAANKQQWSVAYWHHPPYSKGSHDSDDDKDSDARSREVRQVFLPVLEAGGVDLVLCGHSHAYERTALIDGHYGRSTNFSSAYIKNSGEGRKDHGEPYRKRTVGPGPHEGTVYVVAGSSGQASGVKAVHSAMLFALNVAGSLALDFDGPQLEVSFVDTNGIRRDYFNFVKGSPETAPTGSNAFAVKLVSLPISPTPPASLSALGNVPTSERETILKLYRSTTNSTFKKALTWTLAEMADARVAAELAGVITNKVHDRTISVEEEQLRLTTLRALGLVASRYEPAVELLRKGLSADWWYFRTNYISTRPQELSAADLQSCAIEGLALSGRREVTSLLNRARKSFFEFTFGEPLVVFRDYTAEFKQATNALAQDVDDPVTWRRSVVAAELEKLKSD